MSLVLLIDGEALFLLGSLGLCVAALARRRWWFAIGVALLPVGVIAWVAPAWLR